MFTRTSTEVRSSHLRAFDLPALVGRRVALVPEQAVLLAEDRVNVTVRVEAGQTLEIVEPGGTVAYNMRGRRAEWDIDIEIGAGGKLVWHGQPFVVAEGADVTRGLTLAMTDGAQVILRETVVLGRSVETPGRLVSRTDIYRDQRPVLIEEIDSAVGVAPNRVLDQCLYLGIATDPCEDVAVMTLESGGCLLRWLGAAAHASPIDSWKIPDRGRG